MDQFRCYECGMISRDLDDVKKHMNKAHGIKVESKSMCKSFSCTTCKFNTENMKDLKNHQILVHKKESYNWMVEDIEINFTCTECNINFPTQSLSQNHFNSVHSGDNDTVNKTTKKITEKKQKEVGQVFNENIPVKIEEEINTEENQLKGAYCEKSFQTEKGRRIHIYWKHKETQKNPNNLKCNLCEWIGFSEEQLEYHKKESHIEH